MVRKEIEILPRWLGKKRVAFGFYSHKTREFVRCAITENPTRESVRQQLILLSEAVAGKAYLMHDNALVFNIDYLMYNLVSVRTGIKAPNMNRIRERLFGPVRREALDNFLLISRVQIKTILEDYVAFYNSQRPHQGLEQQIPNPVESLKKCDPVCRSAVLRDLHHHYFKQAARRME